MLTLLGWTNPLSEETEIALRSGLLRVIKVTIKGVEVELLQGSFKSQHGYIKEFK